MEEKNDGLSPETQENNENLPHAQGKIFFYIACFLCAAGAVLFGLAFVPQLGIYALISSILSGIAALSFASAQRKRNDFKGVKYVRIAAYAVLAAAVLFFAGGLIYSAVV